MKEVESGWKLMKVDERGWKLMKLDEIDYRDWKFIKGIGNWLKFIKEDESD